MQFMECLNENEKKEKGHFLYIRGKAVIITTSSNLCDKFYAFHDDLRDTIN